MLFILFTGGDLSKEPTWRLKAELPAEGLSVTGLVKRKTEMKRVWGVNVMGATHDSESATNVLFPRDLLLCVLTFPGPQLMTQHAEQLAAAFELVSEISNSGMLPSGFNFPSIWSFYLPGRMER